MLKYNPSLKRFARDLRSNLTDCEHRLWRSLRGKQILEIQFYRQKPIGDYIVDFYAPKAKMVVEIDGGQHFKEENRKIDDHRDKFLQQQGLIVLRFHNAEVNENFDAVLEKIYRVAESRLQDKSPPTPLFQRGEKKER